jgi:hypothetical protein
MARWLNFRIEFFVGMDSILVSCSTGCGVHFPSLFPEFELFVEMGSILVSCSTGCESLFPEFELFVGMSSILVSCSLAVQWIFRIYFQNLNFLWGWVRSSSAVLLAVGSIFRVYFKNLNFLWEWFDPRQLGSTSYASLFPEFELFVGMGSILVSCSAGNMVKLQALLSSRGSRNIGGKR